MIIWHHGDVASGDKELPTSTQGLAKLIQRRRLDLGLSVRQAAETAGIARNTWASAEDGSRQTSDTNFAAIERALRWTPGSISQVKAGGAPNELPDAPSSTRTTSNDADEALIRIMRSDIPDGDKARIVRLLIQKQERARKEWLAMVDEMIADTSD